ncbi:dephospho-CoA kinase [Deinobacterium chartae]|uniref:Dephospho-CoA kinase n=1 Tax=Deinobacterium chartae TaxID=521158 RepID=A0A841I000_9DEIO|nr:dephospho-CoA kinase [Deinobacterium chartae]MBB6097780.1 dephospho-CoA kinase [Deinobacterium chartae]
MRRLGLTGSIGSGKSTVAQLLRQRGLPVLDADQAAREVTAKDDTLQEIAAAFGAQFVRHNVLDRAALAAHVFGHPERLDRLNAIVHPRVRAHLRALEAALEADHPWVVQDIPLLFEGGLEAQMDAVLVVDAPFELRLGRARARDGMSEEQFRARDAAQMPPAEKRRRASRVIENDGSLEDLEAQVDRALQELGIFPPSSP